MPLSLRKVKPGLVWLHRWAGLTLGLLFVLIGLSGSLLVFQHELDEALNPALFHSASSCAAPVGVQGAIAGLRAQWPQAKVSLINLPQPGGTGNFRLLFKAPGADHNEAMADACSGALLGSRNRDALAFDALHLMPLMQRWHLNLLQGKPGRAALGYVGLACALMLAAGLVLAWPRIGQWKRTLSIKLRQNAYRSNYDLHRSLGLLAAVLLLAMALTGFNNGLPDMARAAVGNLAAVSGEHRNIALPALAKAEPGISWEQAHAIAAPYQQHGAKLVALGRLPERGVFQARLRRADDWQRTGTLRLFIDIRTGRVIEIINPIDGTGGDRLLASLFPLHSGQFGGLAGKWLIAFSGLLPALFFITGLTTWILRRKKKTAVPR